MSDIKSVHPTLVRGWQHPAVQRLRWAVQRQGHRDLIDGHLKREVREVVMRGAWMTSFLAFPFNKGTIEAQRLDGALAWLKGISPEHVIVQEFFFRYLEDSAEALSSKEKEGWLSWEEATSMVSSEESASTWPVNNSGWMGFSYYSYPVVS